jgi:hypothetical protein
MRKVRIVLIGVTAFLFSCPSVYCQVLTEEEKLQWFAFRFPIWAAYGFLAGTIVAFAWLRRVKYVPENLSIDQAVRRQFVVSLIVSLIVFAATIWLDLWLISSFEEIIQGPLEALSEMGRSWQTFLLISVAGLTFYVANLVWTRGAFSGRYALWPGPKHN